MKSASEQGEKNNKKEKKMTKKYPKTKSIVTITFLDGEVREYEMSAGNGICKYLVRDASETGMLTLIDYNSKNSTMVPVANIREFSIDEVGFTDDSDIDLKDEIFSGKLTDNLNMDEAAALPDELKEAWKIQ